MKTESTSLLKGRRIVIAASGSIAAVKTPLLVSNLVKAGAEVRCVITPSAAKLVSPLALSTLSRHRCYQDEDQWSNQQARPLHISLAEWAEVLVVAPLTASSLSRWIYGLGDGLLASLLLAFEKPVIAAAAMNTGMWTNKAVSQNWEELQKNPRVLPLNPSSGLLACDRFGDGRMSHIETIQLAIENVIVRTTKTGELERDWKDKRVLISAGPTFESLDPARLITNRSSGKMGVLLCQAAKMRGAKVDLVHGALNLPNSWLEGLSTHSAKSSSEMQQMLNVLQPSADAIAMAAAVADVRRKSGFESKKLRKDSFLNALTSEMETVPDLLKGLVSQKPKNQVLLGFAALTGNDEEIKEQGQTKLVKKGCDLLMANPIDQPGRGFEVNFNGGWLLQEKGDALFIPVTSKLQLAHKLLDALLRLHKEKFKTFNQN